ncbi:unnamed protein product [Sphagnum balticum]
MESAPLRKRAQVGMEEGGELQALRRELSSTLRRVTDDLNAKKSQAFETLDTPLEKEVIAYFLAVSAAQEEIQAIQDDLVADNRFNPVALYKLVAGEDSVLSMARLRVYLKEQAPESEDGVLRMYFEKYALEKMISLQQ